MPVHEGAARLIPYYKARSGKGPDERQNQARDPLDFLMCEANQAPQSCLPLDWATETTEGKFSERASTVTAPSCIDAARQAASIVAASFNLSPRLHARTVEAAVAEATADIVEEAEDAAGRARNQLSVRFFLFEYLMNGHSNSLFRLFYNLIVVFVTSFCRCIWFVSHSNLFNDSDHSRLFVPTTNFK